MFALCLALPIAAEKRALVIGIGNYPKESGWRVISGNNDVKFVETVLNANGYKTENITTLIDSQAQCKDIEIALQQLALQSVKGDEVYIHFSGHGQRITDLNGDEKSGYDECWIPYDAHRYYKKGEYEGQNHLVDDKINGYLYAIREKIGAKGNLIVVSDACHSGGSTQAEDDTSETAGVVVINDVVRGTDTPFMLPQNFSGEISSIPLPKQADWIALAACMPFQTNKECVQQRCGSLTYALYLERYKLKEKSTYNLMPVIRAHIQELSRNKLQEPVVEGPVSRLSEPLMR